VGHSLGAFTSLFAEIRHPGAFSALCLLSPGPANPTLDPVDALDFLIEHGQNRDVLSKGIGQMFVRPPGRTLDLMLDAITLIDTGLFRALQKQNSQTSIDDQLKDVSTPVLLLCGERDNVVLPAKQHDMARKLQRCKEVVFSTEGHMLPNESAAIAAREILAFLDHDRKLMATFSRAGDSSPPRGSLSIESERGQTKHAKIFMEDGQHSLLDDQAGRRSGGHDLSRRLHPASFAAGPKSKLRKEMFSAAIDI
jgi:Serine aminopeptidase, S33